MARIYRNNVVPEIDIPNLDLLTLLLDSEHGVAQPDTVLHIDAADPTNKLTKADLISLTQRIAYGLRTHYSIGASGPNKDVVTVMSYGQIAVPAAFFGVVAAGGIYSAASPSSTVSELARQISIGNSNLIICSAEHKSVVTAAARQCHVPLERVLVLESSPKCSLVSLGTHRNVISQERLDWKRTTDPQELKDSVITILWSSGTTGLPKGVQLSHLNLVAEALLVNYFGRRWAAAEMEKGTYQPMEYRTLAHLPISHIAGLFGYLCMPVYNAGTVYWMRRYRWADLLKYVKEYKITAFYTVPSIFLRMSKSPEVADHFKYVEAASTGAAPMDAKLQQASNARLGNGNDIYIGQTWGLSETTGAVTAPIKGEFDITGSISPILPNVELRIVDDDYKDVEPGQEGELLIRSPLVMNGYYNNEQATKDAFVDLDDGGGKWFSSGDIGVMKEEKFYVVDRKKELLKFKGLQIAPAEIENLLFTHPAVAEAAVVGVPAPDDPGTDWPRAYVVRAESSSSKDEAALSKELMKFVVDRLAQHKQLRGGVVFVNEIPKNAIGKFLRRELREQAKREVAVERGVGKEKARL